MWRTAKSSLVRWFHPKYNRTEIEFRNDWLSCIILIDVFNIEYSIQSPKYQIPHWHFQDISSIVNDFEIARWETNSLCRLFVCSSKVKLDEHWQTLDHQRNEWISKLNWRWIIVNIIDLVHFRWVDIAIIDSITCSRRESINLIYGFIRNISEQIESIRGSDNFNVWNQIWHFTLELYTWPWHLTLETSNGTTRGGEMNRDTGNECVIQYSKDSIIREITLSICEIWKTIHGLVGFRNGRNRIFRDERVNITVHKSYSPPPPSPEIQKSQFLIPKRWYVVELSNGQSDKTIPRQHATSRHVHLLLDSGS
jgi:hypothetical protein